MNKTITSIRDGKRTIQLKATEVAFLRLVCQDLPYKEIAKRMGKSSRTIDGYRDDLFTKLRVRSCRGLVLWSFKSRLLKRKDITLTVRMKKKPH